MIIKAKWNFESHHIITGSLVYQLWVSFDDRISVWHIFITSGSLDDLSVSLVIVTFLFVFSAKLSTLLVGARIGFLTKNIQGLLADLQAVKPHFFFTVPRVLSRLYSVAMEKVSSVPLLPSIFHYAVESKVAEQEK